MRIAGWRRKKERKYTQLHTGYVWERVEKGKNTHIIRIKKSSTYLRPKRPKKRDPQKYRVEFWKPSQWKKRGEVYTGYPMGSMGHPFVVKHATTLKSALRIARRNQREINESIRLLKKKRKK